MGVKRHGLVDAMKKALVIIKLQRTEARACLFLFFFLSRPRLAFQNQSTRSIRNTVTQPSVLTSSNPSNRTQAYALPALSSMAIATSPPLTVWISFCFAMYSGSSRW